MTHLPPQASRLGACEVYLLTATSADELAEASLPARPQGPPAALGLCEAVHGIHSKLWTRRFPCAAAIVQQVQAALASAFERHDADAELQRLLRQHEALHAAEAPNGETLEALHAEGAALGKAVGELRDVMARRLEHASPRVAAWTEAALAALVELQSVTSRAAAHLGDRDLGDSSLGDRNLEDSPLGARPLDGLPSLAGEHAGEPS